MPVTLAHLDDLRNLIGSEIGTTDWFLITQERIARFADATEDHQWIHLDRDRAQQESPYGTTIAHGFLTLSLLSYLSKQAFQIQSGVGMTVNYGLNRVRFPAPVRAESNIRARFTLRSFKDVDKGREAIFSVVFETRGQGKPCCVAEWVIRYYPCIPELHALDAP
jgi:acyl dehydratase